MVGATAAQMCTVEMSEAEEEERRGEARRGNVFGLCPQKQHARCGVGVAVSRGQAGRVDQESGD